MQTTEYLSVPVKVIDWKDSSLETTITFQWKNILNIMTELTIISLNPACSLTYSLKKYRSYN